MLIGKELLEKSKLLSKKSEDEIARGCGYVGPSGRVLRKSFYSSLHFYGVLLLHLIWTNVLV